MEGFYINIIKRLLDIIFSILLLVLLSPIFIIISIAIKIDSSGPIFFRQVRTGLDGKNFILLKFRSMAEDNDIFDFERGDRITKVGHVIRKTSLDEIPQLINVFKGNMSFIGPRPWIRECYAYFTPYQKRRNLVKPGITGLAQVSGRKDLNILKRIDLDIEYVDNINFLLDLKIIGKTIAVVFDSSNNTHENYTVEDEIIDLKNNYYQSLRRKNHDN